MPEFGFSLTKTSFAVLAPERRSLHGGNRDVTADVFQSRALPKIGQSCDQPELLSDRLYYRYGLSSLRFLEYPYRPSVIFTYPRGVQHPAFDHLFGVLMFL